MTNPPSQQGLFLVIEGVDGSGKGTQFDLLKNRLTDEGYDIATFDFPQYDNGSSYFVTKYLNGKYGTAEEIGPYAGSLFFALDRFEAAAEIRGALQAGKIVLANRFTGSNMAHQGTKFDSKNQRQGYYIWLDNLEFEMLGIPRPDQNIVLRINASTAQKYIDKKAARSYTDKKRDIHEADLSHLERAVSVYDELCGLFPKDFKALDCERNGELLPVEQIHKLIWQAVESSLPAKTKSQGTTSRSQEKLNPFVTKTDTGYEITPEGKDFLDQAVSNSEGDVYAFNDKLSTVTIAAAMARLSRRGDDMRITLLDEFAPTAGKDEALLKRVVTAYGDDSVQQLVGLHVVVENASNILTKKLEWGRLAAYLEQSTRYIFFDQKDSKGKYKYFTPTNLSTEATTKYDQTMNEIFDLYSSMVHSITDYLTTNSTVSKEERDGAWKGAIRAQVCDAIRPVLPVSTKSTVGIYASGQALESLIMHLLSDELLEARETGQKLLDESRKIIPTFLERADKPDRGGAWVAYRSQTRKSVQELASKYLPENLSPESDAVSLLEWWPRNELDLVPEMIYEFSNLPLKDIKINVDKWNIDKKSKVFNAYMGERLNRRHKPGRAIEKAHYAWDLVCDYGIFRDLHRHRMVDALEWQLLTPRYGYEMSDLVEDAGLMDQFEKCFDLSLGLYSYMQSKGYNLEAQYATLLGHKMRWKITYNARQAFHIHELRTTPQGHPGYRKIVKEMHDRLSEVHPLLGSAMKFVNKDEDPELTRLAAERYTQFKLNQLS